MSSTTPLSLSPHLRLLSDRANIAFCAFSRDRELLWHNASLRRILELHDDAEIPHHECIKRLQKALQNLDPNDPASSYQQDHVLFSESGLPQRARFTAIPIDDTPEGYAYLATAYTVLDKERLGDHLNVTDRALELTLEVENAAGFWSVDFETMTIEVTPILLSELGYDPENFEHTREQWRQIIHPEDAPKIQKIVYGYLANPVGICQFTHRLRDHQGQWRWFSVIAYVSRKNEEGKAVALTGTRHEITQERQDLLYTERLKEMSQEMLGLMDFEGRFKKLNRTWTRKLGWSEEELLAVRWLDLVHPDDLQATVDSGKLLYSGRLIEGFENRCRHKDGSYRWLSWSYIVMQGERLIQVIARDITEQKEVQREKAELEQALSRAQQMEAIGKLSGGIAHDFKNLLQPILSCARHALEEEEDLSSIVREDLEEISTVAQRGNKLIEHLLAFGRREEIEPQRVDLNALITEQCHGVSQWLSYAGIELIVDLGGNLPGARIDPMIMGRIFFNMITNAKQALRLGGCITVKTSVRSPAHAPPLLQRSYVCLTISDNGEGIVDENRSRVFEPFFTTRKGGNGLGLSTVHGLVKLHRGHVEFESTPGLGTAFHIYFPQCAEAPLQVQEAQPGEQTLLVVGGDDTIQGLIVRILERRGYRVLSAHSPAEAHLLFQKHAEQVNLVLTDLTMGDKNGFQMVEKMQEEQPGLCALYLSGYAELPQRKSKFKSSEGILTKPFTAEKLTSQIKRLLA